MRGTEIRHVSLLERDGVTKVIVPVYRDSMMGVMTLRSEADIAALKAREVSDATFRDRLREDRAPATGSGFLLADCGAAAKSPVNSGLSVRHP